MWLKTVKKAKTCLQAYTLINQKPSQEFKRIEYLGIQLKNKIIQKQLSKTKKNLILLISSNQ